MKKLFTILITSVIVMHYNQDMNVLYWVAVIFMLISGFIIANRLDHECNRNTERDKHHTCRTSKRA